MTVKSVLKKKKETPLACLVMTAKDAKALIKCEQLPDNWLSLALTKINEYIKFQAESKSNHTSIWDCNINLTNADGTYLIIPVKDKDKLVEVSNILINRGYEVTTTSNSFTPGWSMEITW